LAYSSRAERQYGDDCLYHQRKFSGKDCRKRNIDLDRYFRNAQHILSIFRRESFGISIDDNAVLISEIRAIFAS